MKITKILVLSCCILSVLLVFGVDFGRAERIFGKGKDINITEQDVELFKKYLVPQNIEPTEKALFEAILKTKLFSLAAKEQGLDKRPDIKTRLQLEKERLLAQAYVLDYLDKHLKIDDQVIESYYLSHIDEYTLPIRLKLYRIVVADSQEAQEVYKEAQKNPGDFPKLVQKYSTDPATKWKHGEMGFVVLDKLRPEIKEALKDVKAGMVSKPVEIHGFYYIFWVKEVEPKRTIPLEKVKSELKDKIAAEKRQEVLQAHVAELQKKYEFNWEPEVQGVMKQKQQLRVK